MMQRSPLFALFALIAVTGCASEGASPCREPLRVATMNAAFARGDVALVEERVAPLVDALAAEGLHVLCMQEVWLDWDAVVAGLPQLSNTVRRDSIEPCPTPSCSSLEGEPMLDCAKQHCAGLSGPALLECGQAECPDEVGALGGGCLSCIVGNAAGGIDAIDAACTSGDATESYLYECQHDTGILTNATVVAHDTLLLPSYLVAASVDYARVRIGADELDVFCTHLQSDSSLAYQGAFDGWKDEQAAQIEDLLAFIDEKSDGIRPAALLGDLNTGPELDGVDPVWPEHYQRLLDAGFGNPFVAQDDVACTLCEGNTLLPGPSSSSLIDHVLLRGATGAYQRILTDTVALPSGPSSYSDHYGLAADVAMTCSE